MTSTEPLLWKRIVDAKQKVQMVFCFLKKLIEKKLDSLWISLDGIEPTHDEIRGLKGGYKKTATGFLMAKDMVKTRGINQIEFAKDIVQLMFLFHILIL